MNRFSRFLAVAALAVPVALGAAVGSAQAQDRFITVASTTSTENSGLFKHILPLFKAKTGIDVRVIAQGTGQALDTGRRGDADVVFVHAPAAEKKFVAEGHGVERFEVMYNDFVIVGPNSDPAGVKGMKDAPASLAKIAAAKATFASRGDDSGTHKAELRLWKEAGVDVKAAGGSWYRELGSGMGATLNTAAQMPAYALTDRATWISFQNRGDLEISVEGDAKLFNQYGVILVSPEKHKHVKKAEGQAFIDWLVSGEGQKAIADYKLNGQPLFFPNAKKASG
ncbi:substrate-binding domain-containing protein [Oceanibaculum nanhaiense]|uniref:substrate-binding domain-containing protein n=1 Tax=Oceanibaculum nanhaiense TaxID=1909734 RepID=UPI000A39E293|nr:substrate-binding domain-containing protein [Oceanibaculum nanhaiense]